MLSSYRNTLFTLLTVTAIVTLFYYTMYQHITHNVVKKMKSTQKMARITRPFSSTLQTNTTDSAVESVVKIRAFNASEESKEVQLSVSKHKCVQFRTPMKSSQICVHPEKSDKYISGSLIKSGVWEPDLVNLVASSMEGHPNMALLDLGCNIGVFTIYCAHLKRRVVSIDANKENLLLLSRSLVLNHLQDRVTLIWKAMSNVHESVILKGYSDNKGGTYVQSTNQTDQNLVVKTITLDDLIPLFHNESVFIKMDIETYEWNVLNGGYEFFKSVKVGYVLIEFGWHRNRPSGKKICNFMSGFGFRPYGADSRRNILLDVTKYNTWPVNILFVRNMETA